MRNTFEAGKRAAIAGRNSVRFVTVLKTDGRGMVTVKEEEGSLLTYWNARTGREWGTGSRRYSLYSSHLISEADANLRITHDEQRRKMEATVKEVNDALAGITRMGVYWSPEEGKIALELVLEGLVKAGAKIEEVYKRNDF